MKIIKLNLEEGEVAVPIEGYEGLYLVTSLGRVFSMWSGKFLKGSPNEKGYLHVGLYNAEHSENQFYIHIIVAKAFIPNPENKPTVNHKNHKPWDNRVENLEWYTKSEQQDEICRENRRLTMRNTTAWNRSKPCICIESNEFFWSSCEASRAIIGKPCGASNISMCCRGLQQTAYGYHWRYATEEEIQEFINQQN